MAKKSERLDFFTRLAGQSLVDDIHATERILRRYQERFGSKPDAKSPAANWQNAGAVRRVVPYERGVRLVCERGLVELEWVAADCLRVRLRREVGDFPAPFSYAVAKTDWPQVSMELVEDDNALEMRTAEVICRIDKRTFRFGLMKPDGKLICVDSNGIQFRSDGAARLTMALRNDEGGYGLGQRTTGLNLRGRRYQLWNSDPAQPYQRGTDPIYYNVPFYLGVHNSATYGVFWDNPNRGSVDIGASRANELAFETERGELRYYLFAGANANSVLSRYTELTGRINMPPMWMLGYHQSRWSYYPQEGVMKLAETFRQRGIPCDAIHLDIDYMDGYRIFTVNQERFPDFAGMVSDLHEQGFKVVTILDPGVKIDPQYPAYWSGIDRDIFLKYPDGERVAGAVWPGACHFPDFSKPDARAWWTEQLQYLLSTGIDGVWNDMCEPAMFGAENTLTLPDFVEHHQDGVGGDHLDHHNVYGLLMGRATLEGLELHRPGKRQVNIIRAGWAGAQRYAMTWTGDSTSDWDQVRLGISMVLGSGLSGAALNGPDIGGFFGESDGELFTRWLQAASLLPFFRGHSAIFTQPHEPWAFGQPYEVINRMTIQLRYRLLPYLYSVVAQCKEYGWPIVRPLFMAEPTNVQLRSVDDCYLLGESILVAPVLEKGAIERQVYLPEGAWYDFWTNDLLAGGQTITVTAPLERLPLFVRAGSVLPMWPEMQYVDVNAVQTLTLRIYPGDTETTLYEDAGEGLGYEDGDYRWVYIACERDGDKLIINRRTAGRYEPPYQSIKLEVVGLNREPSEVRVDRQGAPVWFYDADILELTVDTFRRVEITIPPVSPHEATLPHRPR